MERGIEMHPLEKDFLNSVSSFNTHQPPPHTRAQTYAYAYKCHQYKPRSCAAQTDQAASNQLRQHCSSSLRLTASPGNGSKK